MRYHENILLNQNTDKHMHGQERHVILYCWHYNVSYHTISGFISFQFHQ